MRVPLSVNRPVDLPVPAPPPPISSAPPSSLPVRRFLGELSRWGVLTVVAVLASLGVVRWLDDQPASPAGRPPAAASPAADRAAVAVLRGWDARRADAYADGDVAALRRLYADGSAAGERDARLLRSYVARGLVVEGMRQQLLGVEVLDEAPNRLTVRVRDRLAAATAVAAGRRLALPRDTASASDVVLVRRAGTWQVWSVDPADRG